MPTTLGSEIPCSASSGGESAFEDFTVELERKAGRGLGISVVGRRDGPGVFLSDMVRCGNSRNSAVT